MSRCWLCSWCGGGEGGVVEAKKRKGHPLKAVYRFHDTLPARPNFRLLLEVNWFFQWSLPVWRLRCLHWYGQVMFLMIEYQERYNKSTIHGRKTAKLLPITTLALVPETYELKNVNWWDNCCDCPYFSNLKTVKYRMTLKSDWISLLSCKRDPWEIFTVLCIELVRVAFNIWMLSCDRPAEYNPVTAAF